MNRYALLVLMACQFAASVVEAQATQFREPTDADFARLPHSIVVEFERPAGWEGYGHTQYEATAIWPRDVKGSGAGCWYRSDTPNVLMYVYQDAVFPRPYNCRTLDAFRGTFECTDVYGAVKRPQCAAQLVGKPEPSAWRSSAGDSWIAWTYANDTDQSWRAWAEFVVVPLASASTSADGQTIRCNYPVANTDVWGMWR
jgi:hypothetical protein